MTIFNTNLKEKDFQTKFLAWLKRNNILVLKIHSGLIYLPTNRTLVKQTNEPFVYTGFFVARKLSSGFSDILIFDKGNSYFIELKAQNGSLRIDQKEKFEELYERKFLKNTFVLKPKMYENLKNYFKEFKDIGKALEMAIGINSWKKYFKDEFISLDKIQNCSHIRHVNKKTVQANWELKEQQDFNYHKYLCENCYLKLKETKLNEIN